MDILKGLTLEDLSYFKDTYQGADAVANGEFRRRTGGSLYFSNKAESIDLENDIHNDLEIIELFGSLTDHLEISYNTLGVKKWHEIFAKIYSHCNKKLSSLTIQGNALQLVKKKDVSLIAGILRNIKTLKIGNGRSRCYISPVILALSVNVKEVKLNFEIGKNCYFRTIFHENQKLSKLEFCLPINDRELEMIVDNLQRTRLQDLTIQIWKTNTKDGNISLLSQLPYLKRLSVTCPGVHATSFLHKDFPSLLSLNMLSLTCIRLDLWSIETLARMCQLEVVRLDLCTLIEISHIECLLALCSNKNLEHLLYFILPEHVTGVQILELFEERKKEAPEKCLHLVFEERIYTEVLEEIPYEVREANKGTMKLINPDDQEYKFFNLRHLG